MKICGDAVSLLFLSAPKVNVTEPQNAQEKEAKQKTLEILEWQTASKQM